jgi:hypothetical protein
MDGATEGVGVGVSEGRGETESIGVAVGTTGVVDGNTEIEGVGVALTVVISLFSFVFIAVTDVPVRFGTGAKVSVTGAKLSVTVLALCATKVSPLSPRLVTCDTTSLLNNTKTPERAIPTAMPAINVERVIIPAFSGR